MLIYETLVLRLCFPTDIITLIVIGTHVTQLDVCRTKWSHRGYGTYLVITFMRDRLKHDGLHGGNIGELNFWDVKSTNHMGPT